MASYQGHLMFSSALGAAYGSVGVWKLNLDWGPAFLGAGVATLGGLLPDLDSDSGVPVRELFGLAATIVPLFLLHRLRNDWHFSIEQALVLLGGLYLFIRYGLSRMFKKYTVHRGMFHSIPAMLIAGLGAYLLYHPVLDPHSLHPDQLFVVDVLDNYILLSKYRCFVAVGVMLGFLSHLVLDELCAVDFMGARITLNKFAGSAVKFWSPSMLATLVCYAILGALAFTAWTEFSAPR